eukprot:gnl/Spiro4/4412_TR2188_c0_g1_i1.p1 gnl/Spiro4/4412_TR2188_c0_g1~~gnl/Spiro4/4412_TR2188_c0_g1_i1.p1  ORF type:complete len:541 (+),score=99.50 gnl/Spiro4/4412_TR2188_c0_g1_i1:83-1624(+)
MESRSRRFLRSCDRFWRFVLIKLSLPIRPIVYEDDDDAVPRNWTLLIIFLTFLVSAIVILYYQLSNRPYQVFVSPVNLNLKTSGQSGTVTRTFDSWNPDASASLVQNAISCEQAGIILDCDCNTVQGNDLMMSFLPVTENNSCMALTMDVAAATNNTALFTSLCGLLSQLISVNFDSEVLRPSLSLLSPLRLQAYVYQAYYSSCLSVVLNLYNGEMFAGMLGVATTVNTTAVVQFWSLLLADLQSETGFFCLGYTSDLTVRPIVQTSWVFDSLLPAGYSGNLFNAATVPALPLPEYMRNFWSTTTAANSYFFDSYVAMYCSPTSCGEHLMQSTTSVLINTLGTLGIIWLLVTMIGSVVYQLFFLQSFIGSNRVAAGDSDQEHEPSTDPDQPSNDPSDSEVMVDAAETPGGGGGGGGDVNARPRLSTRRELPIPSLMRDIPFDLTVQPYTERSMPYTERATAPYGAAAGSGGGSARGAPQFSSRDSTSRDTTDLGRDPSLRMSPRPSPRHTHRI